MYHYENSNSSRPGLNIEKIENTGPLDVKCIII